MRHLIDQRRILDIRSAHAFQAGHYRGAAHHFLPEEAGIGALAKDLPSIFLPPRHVPLTVVGETMDFAAMVAVHLRGRGRPEVEARTFDPDLVAAESIETGDTRHFLWTPPDWLRFARPFLRPAAAGPVLDLACGSGRALVWLARLGYRTVGVDWQPEALELGKQLAAKEEVRVDFRAGDLRDSRDWPQGPWAGVLNFRFLQRDLLEALPRMLQPGGVAVVRTFRDLPGYEGSPHPRHRLQPGELLKFFTTATTEILAHEEGFDSDGRPAAGIVVRRSVTSGG